MEDRGSGKIIIMTSAAGIAGLAASPHYSAAKGALIGFTKSVAQEVIGRGVYVNAIAPGFVDTPLLDIVIPEMMAYITMRTPVGRIGTVEEIASLAVYLASDESSYIVGQIISPNGGEVI
jgi:3-oxoacyl-[acyl-carrier protein] reductase